MGWIKEEKLVCIMEQGILSIIDLDGCSTQVSLGEVAKCIYLN